MKIKHIGGLYAIVYAVIIVLMIVFSMFRGAFVNQDIAVRALDTAGYTEIEIIDEAFFFMALRGGEKSDAARFHAKAINPVGKEVDVYVFSGWLFKGATIRGL